ncbi:Magnesium-chelatase subunit [Chlorella sorokiniana]|uniref:Magnesium-chelatase subunit n=1 Tax=Chlorella sorokiniana TaxID=3076 RepID=A0A2P6TSS4_CHLSO|nr:Magnesium-chelatase subunit [Chlorella sorokiniana]|eukprot:PRW57119.1 Magnesium-chelatase subunit [Chlorella sorokiniana]
MEQSPLVKDLLQAVQLAESRLGRAGTMEAQLTPIQAHVTAGGLVTTQRWDLRLTTSAGRRVHLASWGSGHLSEAGPLDMTVCVAGDTLQLLGLGFPAESGIPVHMSGTARWPNLSSAARASKLVALLLLQQQADKLHDRGIPVPARMRRELEEGLRPFGRPEAFRMPPLQL